MEVVAPPKRRFTYGVHVAVSQNVVTFILLENLRFNADETPSDFLRLDAATFRKYVDTFRTNLLRPFGLVDVSRTVRVTDRSGL
jgi:hypothetical protein